MLSGLAWLSLIITPTRQMDLTEIADAHNVLGECVSTEYFTDVMAAIRIHKTLTYSTKVIIDS